MNGGEVVTEILLGLIDEPAEDVRKAISEEGLEELKSSIAKRGLLQPITLRRKGERYEISMGHRRFLAVKDLGWGKIAAIVRESSDEEVLLDRVHENIHREDMSPVEEGEAAALLLKREKKSIRDIGKMFSKSESWVIGRLDLLEMPKDIREAVDVGQLSIGAARELAAISDDEARRYYVDYAIKQGATAKLCAFWRGKWEVERTVNNPSDMAKGGLLLNPPPMEITIPCAWCGKDAPIQLIEHLRVCPKCLVSLLQARAVMQQEAFDAAQVAKVEAGV